MESCRRYRIREGIVQIEHLCALHHTCVLRHTHKCLFVRRKIWHTGALWYCYLRRAFDRKAECCIFFQLFPHTDLLFTIAAATLCFLMVELAWMCLFACSNYLTLAGTCACEVVKYQRSSIIIMLRMICPSPNYICSPFFWTTERASLGFLASVRLWASEPSRQLAFFLNFIHWFGDVDAPSKIVLSAQRLDNRRSKTNEHHLLNFSTFRVMGTFGTLWLTADWKKCSSHWRWGRPAI